MGILKDEIIGIIIGKGDNRISNKFQELMNEKRYSKFCEEIPGIVEKRVLFPIESEKYFDDLHSFYLSRKVVAKFVISLISTSSKSVVFLSNKFAEEFVISYPQHKTAINRIKELLIMSADIIGSEIKNRELVTDDQEISLFIAQKNKEFLEGQIRVEEKIDEIGSSVKKITQKLEEIQKDANRNVSSVLSIGQLADDTEFAVEIKDVEENIQKELKFSQAITRYNELITDIKENIDRPDELLTYIYINLALCYANSDDFVHADRSLSYAQKYCDWSKNAKYYYVKGYVCWKSDKSNIYSAIEWLDNAISLDHNYFQARILRCQLGAFAGEEKEKVMSLFSDIEENFQEDEKKSEIYEAKGFIYKAYGEYDLAEKWMKKAEKENHCIEYLINLGIVYYSRATENNEHGKRLLKIRIDYPDIFKAYECFQKAMQEMTKEEINLYKKDFIDVYISTCMLCEHPEQIENIQILVEDKRALDYETQRYLTFHEAIRGKNADIDLLSEEDKIFLSYVEKAECGELEEAFQLLKESVSVGEISDLERKYNMALQLAIALKRYDDFKQLRANVMRNKIECPYMDLYDAEYYDLIGDYGRSKKFYDTHIQEPDGLYILNAILFYRKHSYEGELKNAYCLILKKLGTRQIAIHDQNRIIHDAFVYLIENDIDLAFEMLSNFDEDTVKTDFFQQLLLRIYLEVMNVPQLLNIYETNESANEAFEQKINYIILLKYDLQFDKAKEEAEKLLNFYQKEKQEYQIRYLELLSEICLFTGDIDESVKYITLAKDLAQELVYNPVHQLYMSRLIRCGKEEGLSYGIQFKQTHPNVANWLMSFQALEKNEEGETKSTDEFLDIIEKMGSHYDVALSYYRNENISFYQLQKALSADIFAMLGIPDNDRVKFVIGIGNIEKIEEQGEKLGNEIVIDAMTILFIKYYDIIEVLDVFSRIYVTYSSIEELERVFIQLGATLVDDVISWIRRDLRIQLYPNYNKKNEKESFYHPDYFMDSLEAAKREKCQFFCLDARSQLFFLNDASYFVNIMSLVHKEEGERSSILVSKLLLHNVTFINFRADDILYALNNNVDELVINKLFSVECNCDSNSFISVYRIAIIKLLSLPDAKEQIDIFLFQICKQIDRTFSRARMYRWRAVERQSIDCFSKYEFYVKHNINLLFMLYELLAENDSLWTKIVQYRYKYFHQKILERLRKDILEKANKREIVKGLLSYYSFSID